MTASLFPLPPAPPPKQERFAVFSGAAKARGALCFIVTSGGATAALACARRQGLKLERGSYARRVSDAEYAAILRNSGFKVENAPPLKLV